jgi:hypothetical protein
MTDQLIQAADPPRPDQLVEQDAWRAACLWIAQSGEIPADARFLTPKQSVTFKWYSGRAEVVNWKEAPQDAVGIVEWWRRMRTLHGAAEAEPEIRWFDSLSGTSDEHLEHLQQWARTYEADYLITSAEPPMDLEVVYDQTGAYCPADAFIIYRLR